MAEWTPPRSRLPAAGQTVEALDGAGRMVRRVFDGGRWFADDGSVYTYVAPVFWRAAQEVTS